MYKSRYIFTILLIEILGLISCTSETEVIKPELRSAYNVSFSINNGTVLTREAGAESGDESSSGETPAKKDFTTTALEREKTISSLYAVAFNKADDSFYKAIKIETSSTADAYEFNMGRGGSYKLLLVANADEALAQKLEALTSSSTLTDFSALVATQTPGESAEATDFLMVSEINNEVSVTAHNTTQLGTIELNRLAARFDFYNQVKGFKMTKITFKNRAMSSLLAESGDASSITISHDKVYTSANGLNPLSAVGVIYGYEDAKLGDCELVLEGIYNGKDLKEQTIKFDKKIIERNHLYNIILTDNESGITPSPDDPTDENEKYKINIHVAVWNDAETFGFVGAQLVNKDAPTFEASGAGVTTIPATKTDFAVVKTFNKATTVTILATSASSSDSQLICDGDLPSGWHIVDKGDKDISHKNGRLTHQFTIEMNANTTENDYVCKFKVANIFNPSASVSFTVQQNRIPIPVPPNPLKYVAEYNLASAGKFTTEHSIVDYKNGWFNWQQVHDNKIAPDGYHVPSADEIRSIVTNKNAYDNIINGAEGTITIHGNTISDGTYDTKKMAKNLVYALRFKNSDGKVGVNTCAFRYYWEDNKGVNVTCRALGADLSCNINIISEEEYWKSNKKNDITRFFPSCGYKISISTNSIGSGNQLIYYSSTEYNKASGFAMCFAENVLIMHDDIKTCCLPVRVFRD